MAEKRQLEEAVEPEPKRIQLMVKALYNVVMDILSQLRPIAKVIEVSVSATKFTLEYKVLSFGKIQAVILRMLKNWISPKAIITLTQVDWNLFFELVLPHEGFPEKLQALLQEVQVLAGKYHTKILSDTYWPRQANSTKNELNTKFQISNNTPTNDLENEIDILNPDPQFINMLQQHFDSRVGELVGSGHRVEIKSVNLQMAALGELGNGPRRPCLYGIHSGMVEWQNPADKQEFYLSYFNECGFGTLMFDNGQLFVFHTDEDMNDRHIPTPTNVWTWYGVKATCSLDFTRFRVPQEKTRNLCLQLHPLWKHLFKSL